VRQNAPAHRPAPAEERTAAGVRLVFAGPEGLASPACGVGGGDVALVEWVVRADDGNLLGQLRVFQHLVGDGPLAFALARVLVAADDLRGQMRGLQRVMEHLHKREVKDFLIPWANVGNVETVVLLRCADEVGKIGGHLLCVERGLVAGGVTFWIDPTGRAPWENLKNDLRVALVRLGHQPPLVAARGRVVAGCAHVTGLGAVCRVHICADFDLEMLQCRTVAGLK